MAWRWLRYVAIVVAVVVLAVLLLRRPAARTPLTPEMRQDFGATAYLPESVSGYASHKHLARLWKQVWESQAMQSLVALPVVQDLWKGVETAPPYRSLVESTLTDPFLVQALPVLQDAVSSEVFVCTGPEFPDFIAGFNEVSNEGRFMDLGMAIGISPRESPRLGPSAVVESILKNKKRLRVPSLLFGFKLSNPDAARQLLSTWLPRLNPTPVGTIEKRAIRGGEFHVLEIHAESVLSDFLRTLPSALERQGVPEAQSRELVAWLADRRVALAAGTIDGYLIVSVGEDTSLLEHWGRGASLAESGELEPVRASYKPGLLSLSFTSTALAEQFALTGEDIKRFAERLTAAIPDRGQTAGIRERVRKDVDQLVQDLGLPKPSSSVAVSYENKGIESFSFGGPPTRGLDYSQPIAILAHRGKQPLLVLASRAAKNPAAYEKFAKWANVGFGYFQDFAVPEFEHSDRQQYEKVMKLVKPFFGSLDEAMRQGVFPAIDGAQSLLVLDGQGSLAVFPDGTRPPKPIPIPRVGLAVELNDPKKLTEAVEQCMEALRKAIEEAKEEYPGQIPPGLKLPSPQVADAAGGKLYFYPLPWDLGSDVLPCALLKDRLLVLASSTNLANEMAEAVPMPTSAVVPIGQAAGAVALVDFDKTSEFLRRATASLFALIEARQEMDKRERSQARLIQMQLDALWRSLGALREYASATTLRDGHVVTRSWLHVEDIAK